MSKVKPFLTVALPYALMAAIVAATLLGKLSPDLAAMLAVMLGVPSPLQHAAGVASSSATDSGDVLWEIVH